MLFFFVFMVKMSHYQFQFHVENQFSKNDPLIRPEVWLRIWNIIINVRDKNKIKPKLSCGETSAASIKTMSSSAGERMHHSGLPFTECHTRWSTISCMPLLPGSVVNNNNNGYLSALSSLPCGSSRRLKKHGGGGRGGGGWNYLITLLIRNYRNNQNAQRCTYYRNRQTHRQAGRQAVRHTHARTHTHTHNANHTQFTQISTFVTQVEEMGFY